MNYTQTEIKKLVKKTKPEDRKTFLVDVLPKFCIEYLSTGHGDTSCGGNLKRLTKDIARCQACETIYRVK